MVRATRRWLCWSVCFLLLFSISLMAQEQETTLPFDESNISLLESNLMHSVTVTTAGTHKVTLETPPTIQGQILLALYDQNSRFKKVVSVHSNGQTSAEFTFEETPLEIGSYVRAFFIGDNWGPVAKSSAKTAVQAEQKVSNLYLTTDGLLSFQTNTPGAVLLFNDTLLTYETVEGWNQVTVNPLIGSLNEIRFQKNGYTEWIGHSEANLISGLRISEYPKRIYRQNESLDITGIVLEATTDGNTWTALPVKPEHIQGFQSILLGDLILNVHYGNQSVSYTARVVASTGATQTGAGLFSVSPSEAFQTDIRDIQLQYITKEVFINGRLSYTLPEGLVFQETDLIKIPGMDSPVEIRELTETAVILNEGRNLSLSSLNLASNLLIEVSLLQRELPRLANLQIEVIADSDGNAEIFTPATKMMQSINLTPGEAMSGKLFLPVGKVAPAGGLLVQLHAVGTQEYTKEIFMPEGSSEIAYRLVLPQGQYKMYYVVPSFSEQRRTTYYDTTGIYAADQVEMLQIVTGGLNLNVQICEYFQISGTIRLPEGETAIGNTWVYFSGRYTSSNLSAGNHWFQLIEGTNTMLYEALVFPGNNYLQYNVDSQVFPYVNKGYYHNTGTKLTQSEAEILNVQEDRNNINFMFLKGFIVSGKITIPDTDILLTKNVSITVLATSGNNSLSSRINFEMGTREVTYNLVLPRGDYVIRYNINILETPYVRVGYYSNTGTTPAYNSASSLAVYGDTRNIDFTLIKGFLISGKVSVPEAEATPTKDISIEIIWISSNTGQGNRVTIKAGTREATYQFVISPGTYYFYYNNLTQDVPYVQGYYSTNGTTATYSSRTELNLNSNIIGIDFTLIKGHLVSGRVSIPELDVTPLKDISVYIHGTSSNASQGTSVIIKAGTREANYQMVLPSGTYYFTYNIQNQDVQYVPSGYYSIIGTTAAYSSRTDINLNSNINGFDFTLIKGHLVSGRVSIPELDVTQLKDISVYISGNSSNASQGTTVIIKAGTREANYQMVLPSGTYYFTYNIQNQDVQYVRKGYYSTTGTAAAYSSRTERNLYSNISGVDFTLIKGHLVSGRVSFPDVDVTPVKDITIDIFWSSSNTGGGNRVTIKAGTREANYQMVLPEESYTIRFYINTQDTPFVREGFYSINGTVPRELASSILVDKNISNLDLVLQKKSFFGTVSLPNNISVLSENLEVRVISESISDVSETSVTVYSGERTANFVLPMAAGENTVKYQIGANDNFITQGYYYYGGTYPNLNYAQKYNTTNHISNIIFTLVPAYSLTGKVSLPEGEIAGAEGIAIKLTTEALYASAQAPSVQILIGPGQSSADFELKQLWGGYRLRYDLVSSSSLFEQVGYLGDSKTVSSTNDSMVLELNQSSLSKIDFELLIKTSIQGSISLPATHQTNTNQIPISIYVSGSNLRVIETEIPEGETSVSFTGEVPVGDYEVYYDLKEASNTWVARGYFNQNGMQQTSSKTNVIHIRKEGVSNLSLQLIPLTKLQGVITLPTGIIAPDSGLSVVLYAMGDLTYRQLLEIPSGSNQVPYELFVSAGNYELLLVDESSSKDIMPVAYYNELGMRIRPEQASEIYVGDSGLVQNLQLLSKPKISGVVSLPTGIVAPPQGLSVLMKAYSSSAVVGVSSSNLQLVSSANLQLVSAANLQLVSSSNLVTQTVQIQSGECSTSYNLPVNPGEYTLSYEVTTPYEGLVEEGFYSSNGVTSVATERITVQSDDISNINLGLSAKAKILGQIILPEGVLAPPEGMTVQMTAMGEEEVSISCIIPSGETSTDFLFYLVPGEYYIHYQMTNDLSLIKEGYINNEGRSTKYSDEAIKIIAGSSDVVLQLQRPFSLTGAVKTDGLYPLPDNGLDLVVRAIGKSTFVNFIHLTEDQPQADFTLLLPEDTYKIAVVVDEAQAIYYKSGYLDSGMLTSEAEQADTYMMNADLTVGVITVPTKIINVFKTPELSMLREVKTLETANVVEKVVDNPKIVEGLEKVTDVDGLDQEVQVIESSEEFPSEVEPSTYIENEGESTSQANPDVGEMNDFEEIRTDTTEAEDVTSLTESTEVIEESMITDDTEKTSVIDAADAPVVSEPIETDIVEVVTPIEKNETESDNLMSLLSISPSTMDPIIVKLSSNIITSVILTIKLPVVDRAFTNVWVGSHNYIIQPDGTFNFSFNNLVEGTTIYEMIAIDSSANSTFGKLIIASVPDSDSFEDYLLRWDRTGPVIQLEDVYTVNTKPAIISFHVSDESRVSEVWVGYEKAFVGPGGSTYISFSNLIAGVNEFDVLAYDEHGNATSTTLVVEYIKPSTVLLTIGSTNATKDGAVMTGMDQAPLIVNGRVFLPFRFVFMNLLGSTVEWDANTQTITTVVKGNTIKMVIGSKTAYVNGDVVALLEAPYIEAFTGRTLVPMREIMEAIGISLDWNGTTQTVTITIPQ